MSARLVACAGVLALAACAPLATVEKTVQATQKQVVQLRDENIGNAGSGSVTRTSRPRLAGELLTLRAADALPPVFDRKITYATQGAQSLANVLEELSAMAGMTIVANEIAQPSTAVAEAEATTGLQARVQFEFVEGRLRALLDMLATRNNASWRYVAASNSVEIFRFETRTLAVSLPRKWKKQTGTIAVGSVSGERSGGGASSSVTQGAKIDPWATMLLGIQTILGEEETAAAAKGGAAAATADRPDSEQGRLTVKGANGRASASPDFGLVTVTARPAVMQRIAAYVNSINQRYAQNVMVDVKILNVTLDHAASAGLRWDLVYKKLSGNGVTVVGTPPVTAGGGTPGQVGFSVGNSSSRWNGSQLVISALQELGDVSVQTHQQVIAVNGQPQPMQVATDVPYADTRTQTVVPNVGVVETATTASRIVGLTGSFTPTIQGDNRILLEYELNIEELISMATFPVGTGALQRPVTTVQSLPGQAYVRDGEPLVLFAFDKSRDTASSAASVGGASKAGRNERQLLVIVIQVFGGLKNV